MPQSAVQGIENNILNIVQDLVFAANELSQAANESMAIQVSSSCK